MTLLLQTLRSYNIKENSFEIPFINKNIKIFADDEICSWVEIYKPEFYNKIIEMHKNDSSFNNKIPLKMYALINYFFSFISFDISHILKNNFLPKPNSVIIELGSGIGLFPIFLNKALGYPVTFDLVELEITHEEKDKQSFYNKFKSENRAKIGMDDQSEYINREPINTLHILKKFTSLNKVECNIYSPDEILKKQFSNKYDYMYSFRSYCFLYPYSTYSDFLKDSMKPNSLSLCDLETADFNQEEEFKQTFNILKVVKEKSWWKRVISIKK